MAGTCRMKGSANCCLDNGECLGAPVRRRSTVAGSKIAAVERREARVPGNNGTRHLPKVPDCYQRQSGAPLPHVGEGKEKDGGPHADQKMGTMNHVCLLLETVRA